MASRRHSSTESEFEIRLRKAARASRATGPQGFLPGNGHVLLVPPAPAPPKLDVALKRQYRRYRKNLRRCQEHFSETAVHDFRVETRRLLSLVRLLDPFLTTGLAARIEVRLKRHLDLFGDLRDAQVQLRIVGRMRRAFSPAAGFYDWLRKQEKRHGQSAARGVRRLKTRRLRAWITDCRRQAARQREKSSPNAVALLLAYGVGRAFERARRCQSQIDPGLPKTIHRTRVAFKSFRYMVEMLADFLPWADARVLARLRRYQTLMGDIQDNEVLMAAAARYLRKCKAGPAATDAFQREFLRRRQALIQRYLRQADQLRRFWPPPGFAVKAVL